MFYIGDDLKGYNPLTDGFAEQRANERKQLAIVAVHYLITLCVITTIFPNHISSLTDS